MYSPLHTIQEETKRMQQPMAPQGHMPNPMGAVPKKKKLSTSQLVIAALLFGVAILSILVLVSVVLGGGKGLNDAVKKDKYQALFLNSQDGQVYFGKLKSYNAQYYKLSDIFYVRVENKIQPEGQQQANNTAAQQSISLAKLGNELHGPEDEMFISKDKVLFWENLKEEGQVVKAIREYKKNPDAANKANTTAPATTGTGTSAGNVAPATTTPAPTTAKP
jgi:hypothetical protein